MRDISGTVAAMHDVPADNLSHRPTPAPHYTPSGLVACPECDRLHQLPEIADGERLSCERCGATLARHLPDGVNRALAWHLTALVLLVVVNVFPFLALKLGGRIEQTKLLSGAWAMVQAGQWELGVLVAATSVVFPLLNILAWLYLLLPLRFGRVMPGTGWVLRWSNHLAPWSLIGVFMLGVLVAFVKLLDLAEVIPGVALYAFVALLFVYSAARVHQDSSLLWPLVGLDHAPRHAHPHALQHELHCCHHCGLLVPSDHDRCPRCHAPLHARHPNSLGRTWALMIAAAVLLVPANIYPVMTVIRFGTGEPSTIIAGIVHLIDAGMIPLGLLVLFASIVVPLLKLLVLSFLLISIQRRSSWRPRDRTVLYRATEVIGAWSMVDVYLVAILAALVRLDALATIRPGIGVTFFAAAVVLTMLAAHSFDPRLIWDHNGDNNESAPVRRH